VTKTIKKTNKKALKHKKMTKSAQKQQKELKA